MTVNIIITLLLILLAVRGVWYVRKRSRTGGGCCGEHEEAVGKTRVADRNKKHYPYRYTLKIGGMTCENCARKVENALNSLPGSWASVDISTKQALVRLKEEKTGQQLQNAVASAGYTVLEISKA